jgi:plasmid stability protein
VKAVVVEGGQAVVGAAGDRAAEAAVVAASVAAVAEDGRAAAVVVVAAVAEAGTVTAAIAAAEAAAAGSRVLTIRNYNQAGESATADSRSCSLGCRRSDFDSCFLQDVPMPTLYVRNVPKARYEALRKRARANHRSIAAEFLALLRNNILTEKELRARQKMLRKNSNMPSKKRSSKLAFRSSEELVRDSRER